MKFTFSDFFAGIGGMRLAFEKCGGKCVTTVEINSKAMETYNLNFKDEKNHIFHDDILTLDKINDKLPYSDIFLAGFPCQPYSIAGLRKGLKDVRGGEVFTAIIKLLKAKKPRAFLLENVKNMKSHDNGKTFKYMINQLEKCGYYTKNATLNSMEHANIPQNRERVFIVGFKKYDQTFKFNFPNKVKLTKTIHDCLENKIVDAKYFYDDRFDCYKILKKEVLKDKSIYQWRRVYARENKNNVCPTLTFNMGSGGHNVPLIKTDYKLKSGINIRKLTPRETANFQGFPKSFKFPKISDSNLYSQFGNSVTVPLIKKIAEEMIKVF